MGYYAETLENALHEFFDEKVNTEEITVVDLGKLTSDHDNTELVIGIVQYNFGGEVGDYYEDQEQTIKELRDHLAEIFDEPGDHAEDFQIDCGNNDIYIMLNANK